MDLLISHLHDSKIGILSYIHYAITIINDWDSIVIVIKILGLWKLKHETIT